MISLITVGLSNVNKYLPHLEESIVNKTCLIDEVIIPKVDIEKYNEEWTHRGIKFRIFGTKQPIMNHHSPALHCLHHALGLHSGIDQAKNDLIMLSDPDVFFLSDIDKFYTDFMKKYNLNIIGLSHPAAITQSFTYFPNVLNCLLRKSEMPDNSFLEKELTLHNSTPELKDSVENISLKGKFLVPTLMPGTEKYFPNPEGHYETGCQLVIWAKEHNWKWLSFQTSDCYNYTSQYYRSNFAIKDKIERRKLLYHVMHGASMSERFEIYLERLNDNTL